MTLYTPTGSQKITVYMRHCGSNSKTRRNVLGPTQHLVPSITVSAFSVNTNLSQGSKKVKNHCFKTHTKSHMQTSYLHDFLVDCVYVWQKAKTKTGQTSWAVMTTLSSPTGSLIMSSLVEKFGTKHLCFVVNLTLNRLFSEHRPPLTSGSNMQFTASIYICTN